MSKWLIIAGAAVFWLSILAIVLWRAGNLDRHKPTRRAGRTPASGPYVAKPDLETTGTFYLPPAGAPALVPLAVPRFQRAPRAERPETLEDVPKHAAWTMREGTTRLVPLGDPAGRAGVPEPPVSTGHEDEQGWRPGSLPGPV